MNISAESRIGQPCSNSAIVCFGYYHVDVLGKGMNPSLYSTTMVEIE